ncbi:hypothetical protein GQ600_12685 [Phytophthora cactorum]|nr:hypothetical protein GQ600_12685 [Phytophthora cactorum]
MNLVVLATVSLQVAQQCHMPIRPTTGDEGKITEHDDERGGGQNLFSALKLSGMGRDVNYRDKVFQRWKNYGHTVESVTEKRVPDSLIDAFETYLRLRKTTGRCLATAAAASSNHDRRGLYRFAAFNVSGKFERSARRKKLPIVS